MNLKLTIWTALILACFVLVTFSQNKSESHLDIKINEEFLDTNLQFILNKLAVKYKVPIGFEKALSEKYSTTINISANNVNLSEFLDLVFQQENRYVWSISDGVVNITPREGRSKFLQDLLSQKITKFEVILDGANDKFYYRDRILALPEVIKLTDSRNIEIKLEYYPSNDGAYSKTSAELTLSKVDLRKVLNTMVAESEFKIWVIDLTGRDQNKLRLSF